MIGGKFQDETLHAIKHVIGSTRLFVVCGSRFFGDAKPNSDFDFVTEDKSLYSDLIAAGWGESNSDKGGYLDSNTYHVLNRGKVQIIIAHSLARRIAARDYIVKHGLNRNKTESWEKAYESI